MKAVYECCLNLCLVLSGAVACYLGSPYTYLSGALAVLLAYMRVHSAKKKRGKR